MTTSQIAYSDSELLALRDAIHKTACEHGWWEGFERGPDGAFEMSQDALNEKLFLVVTELAEAFEEYRAGKGFAEIWFVGETLNGAAQAMLDWQERRVVSGRYKPEGFPIEMADAHIRVLDLMGALNLRPYSFQYVERLGGGGIGLGSEMMLLLGCLGRLSALQHAGEETRATRFSELLFAIEEVSVSREFDLREAIKMKMLYNETRPYRHGGKKA